MSDLITYHEYHLQSSEAKDIGPANDCLRYVCDRFELNIEQRYWLAFLYSCTYSPTTTYYIYNEFPDFENVDLKRLTKWWNENKAKTLFQSDRLRIKTTDAFLPCYESYKALIGTQSQEEYFNGLESGEAAFNYQILYQELGKVKHIGRFTLFIYIEMIAVLTGFDVRPDTIDLKNATSCRNGLAYAVGNPELSNHLDKKRILSPQQLGYLDYKLNMLRLDIESIPYLKHKSIFNIETTLCAYKKYVHGKRYVGFYIERAKQEIYKMQERVTAGVDWSVLWDFRNETYDRKWLTELY